MAAIAQTISDILSTLPQGVRLVAVSKYHPASMIEEAYSAGQRIFGESHVQELRDKHAFLPQDIEWHFIGHLQTNKVKYIVPFVSLIHSVDSLRLLAEIDRQASRAGRVVDCLLQLHVAMEETKFGFMPDELLAFMESGEWREMRNARICGLMCMASNVDDKARIAGEFQQAQDIYLHLRERYFADADYFRECSWGMSDDYPIAVRHGSTIVRIGSRIFGERDIHAH